MTFSTFSSPGVSLQGGSGSGSGGTPGGSTTQIQYNNAGAFAGASGLTTNGTNLTLGSASQLLWSTDLILTRKAAANFRFGAADAAAPVAQTLSVQSVVAGTTNTAGANLTIAGSQGTGTGSGGSIIFQVAFAGGSGSTQNALATAMTIGENTNVTFANAVIAGSTSYIALGSTRARLSSPADSILRLSNSGLSDFDRLQFGGTSSSFPAIKRSGTTLQARLADDTAFASVQGKLTTDTAYAAGAPTATGYLVVYDSAGTAYRIPAVLN
jgi:hypothetical protein